MDTSYKSIRTVISAAIALALTGVLLWGILDEGVNPFAERGGHRAVTPGPPRSDPGSVHRV
jgi:hypothetical protein